MASNRPSLDLTRLGAAYRSGAATPLDVALALLAEIEARGDDGVWISRVPAADLRARAAALAALPEAERARLPLYGVPFAVKDNLDALPLPTTAGCPAFAYLPERSAPAVARLEAAGAMLLGKTNLDQFAAGLVGVRSPYGVPPNPFDADYVPGGSSSGSAVAVAAGLASFALGTDTAGSGRVPAAFNNIVGLKPTRGLISTTGLVPACRSLDCVSVFALTAADAQKVLDIAGGDDPDDAYGRSGAQLALPGWQGLRVAVPKPADRRFFGDDASEALYEQALGQARALGAVIHEIDYGPFAETAALLYQGPWVAERLAAIESFIGEQPGEVWPVTRRIIEGGASYGAVDTFRALYRLEALRRATAPIWDGADILLLPTAGTIYRKAELEADPVALNSNLGTYTNFVNLLDLAAIAVPAGFRPDGLPFGVTFLAPAWHDRGLSRLGQAWQQATGLPLGATAASLPDEPPVPAAAATEVEIAVVGAHLTGQPLNHELLAQSGRLVRSCRTAPIYRLFALAGTRPPKPGLVRVGEGGAAVEIEIWRLPAAGFGRFVAAVPPPMAIGTLTIEDGSQVKGFLCEPLALEGSEDITHFGGWRAFRASLAA